MVIHEQRLVRGHLDDGHCGVRNRCVVVGLHETVKVTAED
jgi:hypothetical protein